MDSSLFVIECRNATSTSFAVTGELWTSVFISSKFGLGSLCCTTGIIEMLYSSLEWSAAWTSRTMSLCSPLIVDFIKPVMLCAACETWPEVTWFKMLCMGEVESLKQCFHWYFFFFLKASVMAVQRTAQYDLTLTGKQEKGQLVRVCGELYTMDVLIVRPQLLIRFSTYLPLVVLWILQNLLI